MSFELIQSAIKTLIELEREGDSTFKKGWSLSELIKTGTN